MVKQRWAASPTTILQFRLTADALPSKPAVLRFIQENIATARWPLSDSGSFCGFSIMGRVPYWSVCSVEVEVLGPESGEKIEIPVFCQ